MFVKQVEKIRTQPPTLMRTFQLNNPKCPIKVKVFLEHKNDIIKLCYIHFYEYVRITFSSNIIIINDCKI